MAGYADELSLKLTAKDEMSARLKEARKELTTLEKQLVATKREMETTGAPEAAREYERLSKQYDEVAARQREMAKANAANERSLKALRAEAGRTNTAMDRLGGSIVKHQKAIQRAGLIMGAAMVLFGKQSVQAFAEAEKQQAMLTQAYGRFPKMADVTRQSFDALNTSIMNMTGADDDALASAEALLARFDLTGRQIQELMPLVNDYAIATGQDLPSAASTMGKAMLGNAKALKAMGINFKASGDRAADYAAIMGILQDKVGGVGEAFGKTTAGQLAIANENFENMKEEVGAALVPAIQSLVAVLRPLNAFITGLPQPVKQVVMVVGALGVAAMIATPRIIAMKAALEKSGIALPGFGKGATKAAVGIAAIATAVMALNAARNDGAADPGGYADDTMGAFRDIIQPGWYGTVNNAAGAITKIVGFIPGLDQARNAVAGVDSKLVALVSAGNAEEAALQFEAIVKQTRQWGGTVDDVKALLPGYISMVGTTADGMAVLTDVVRGQESAFGSLTVKIDANATAMLGLAEAMGVVDAANARRQARRAYNAAVKAFTKDPTVENAEAAQGAANALAQTFKNPRKQARLLEQVYPQLRTAIRNANLPAAMKAALIDPMDRALAKIATVKAALATLASQVANVTAGELTGGGQVPHLATGGMVRGPGTGTSDSIPARLSNGEYVIRAAAVRAIGTDTLNRLNVADRTPVLPAIVNAPTITLPAATVGRDAPLVGQMVIHASSQVDVELALAREARRQERDRRTRTAGTR